MHHSSKLTAAIPSGDRTLEVRFFYMDDELISDRALNTRPVVVENSFAAVRSKSATTTNTNEGLDSIDNRIFTIGMSQLPDSVLTVHAPR